MGLRTQLETATTAALGYRQVVTVKDMPASISRAKVPWDRQSVAVLYGTEYRSIGLEELEHVEHC